MTKQTIPKRINNVTLLHFLLNLCLYRFPFEGMSKMIFSFHLVYIRHFQIEYVVNSKSYMYIWAYISLPGQPGDIWGVI